MFRFDARQHIEGSVELPHPVPRTLDRKLLFDLVEEFNQVLNKRYVSLFVGRKSQLIDSLISLWDNVQCRQRLAVLHQDRMSGRGRERPFGRPPAQIRICGT
jgi:hypothetical protein